MRYVRVTLDVKDVVSYLNEQASNFDKHKDILFRLLKASLDGRDQNRIQDEVARMLGFPGIDGFIRENYGSRSPKVIEVPRTS